MSAPRDDGGPAFPAPEAGQQHFGDPAAYPGMTLRDAFAGLAMLGEIITSTSDATPESSQALATAAKRAGRSPEEHVAFNAYQWADAMLEARSK